MKIKGKLGPDAFPPRGKKPKVAPGRSTTSPTQRARLEKVEYYRALIENAMDGIAVTNEDGVIRFHSPSLTTILGYPSKELIGQSFLSLVHPDDVPVVQPWFDKKKSPPGRAFSSAFRVEHKRGDWRVVECNMNDLTGNETVGGIVISLRDITERALAEREVNENRAQLRSLASALSMAEEKERRQLATELHDSLGQMLALANIKLGAVMDDRSGEVTAETIGEIRDIVRDGIKMVRTLTFDLSPPVLYQVGFEAAVEWLGKRLEREHGIHFYLHSFGKAQRVGEDVRLLLFHVVRELLLNVVKHADADHAKVFVSRGEGNINVVIEDDGRGFDTEILSKRRADSQTFGLFSIHERINHIGGGFSVYSEDGEGTTVSLSVPLARKD